MRTKLGVLGSIEGITQKSEDVTHRSDSPHSVTESGATDRADEQAIAKGPPREAEVPREAGSMLSHASGWFAAIVGLAYATGYLIVSTFLGGFGIEDATGEILRLRYLQVGFYFLISLGSLVVLMTYLFKYWPGREDSEEAAGGTSDEEGGRPRQNVNVYSIPVWIEFLLAIYLAVGFAEPNLTGRQSLKWVAWLTVVVFTATAFLYSLWKVAHDSRAFAKRYPIFYVFLLLIVGALGWKVIEPFQAKLQEFFHLQSLMFLNLIAFMGALGWLSYHVIFRRHDQTKRVHALYHAWRAALGLPIYYLSVLTFAYCVYPFMPVSKGGGYYSESSFVRLTVRTGNSMASSEAGNHVKSHSPGILSLSGTVKVKSPANQQLLSDVLPRELMESETASKPLVLIEQNSDAIFVADPDDPKDPPLGHAGGVKCWTDFLVVRRFMRLRRPAWAELNTCQ